METSKIYKDPEIGEVRFVKSRRATRIGIRVHPVKGVSVSIPYIMSYDSGMRFYLDRRTWVLDVCRRQREKMDSAQNDGRAIISLKDGDSVRTLISEIKFVRVAGESGKNIAKVSSSKAEDVSLTGRLFLCLDRPVVHKTVSYSSCLPQEGSVELSDILKGILVNIIRDEAKNLLAEKLSYFAERHGFVYNRMTVKHNLSNWGSCSSRSNINLNLNLLRLPEPLCDYVLLHELSHLRHPNHGAGFHELLEKLCHDDMERLDTLVRTVKGPSDDVVYYKKLREMMCHSRSSFPIQYILEKEIKKFRLL